MSIQIGNLYRKRTVRRMNGEIIDMTDEANGGALISKGRVVNQERINEIAAIEEDKQKAAQALTAQVVNPNAEDRTMKADEVIAKNNKLEELESRIEAQDTKLDAILAALKK